MITPDMMISGQNSEADQSVRSIGCQVCSAASKGERDRRPVGFGEDGHR